MTQRSFLNVLFGEIYQWHPLVNCARFAQRPIPLSTSKANSLLDLTSASYPTNLSVGCSFTVYLPGNADGSSVTYVVKWRGNAAYSHSSFGNMTSTATQDRTFGNQSWTHPSLQGDPRLTNQQVNGRATFALSGASGYNSLINLLGDATAGTNPLTEFVICRADEEDYYDTQRQAGVSASLIFRPTTITELKAGKWAGFRFMDAWETNSSTWSDWSDRSPLEQLTLHSYRLPRIVSGTGNAGELAYSLTGGGTVESYSSTSGGTSGAYVHGESVNCVPLTSNTITTPTYNRDGRGTKVIQNGLSSGGPVALIATGSNPQTRLLSGTMYTLTYDANYDVWIAAPGGVQSGYPIEFLCGLANAVGVPAWLCVPVYGSVSGDTGIAAGADFVTQLGNYLANTPNYSQSKVFIEYGNEIWNAAGTSFINTARVEKAGLIHFTSPQIGTGTGAAYSAYYGLRMRQISAVLRPILGSKLKMVLASQGSAGDSSSILATNIENLRFQNSTYPELSGSNAPWKFADVCAYALYSRPNSLIGDFNDIGWSSITQAATLKTLVDNWIAAADPTSTLGFDSLKTLWLADTTWQLYQNSGGRYDNWNTLAAKYGLEVRHYEDNTQFDAPSTTFCGANPPWSDSTYGGQGGKINQFLLAFYKSAQFQAIMYAQLQAFYGYSQSVSTNLFALCGTTPWPTHAKVNPTTDTTVHGNIVAPAYGGYLAAKQWNNLTTRSIKVSN